MALQEAVYKPNAYATTELQNCHVFGLSVIWPQGSLSWNCIADALMFAIGIPSLTACKERQRQLRNLVRSGDVALQPCLLKTKQLSFWLRSSLGDRNFGEQGGCQLLAGLEGTCLVTHAAPSRSVGALVPCL